MKAEAADLSLRRAEAQVADSSQASVTALYREHSLGLMRLAVIMVGDRPTAEDVVQDAFLGLHRRWAHLNDKDKALTYVRSAVLNNCRSVLRRRRLPLRGHHEPPAWSAEAAVLVGEERRAVLTALQRLPGRQRESLVLRYFCEFSEREIATTMGVSRGTVKSTISRAIAALGRILEEGER